MRQIREAHEKAAAEAETNDSAMREQLQARFIESRVSTLARPGAREHILKARSERNGVPAVSEPATPTEAPEPEKPVNTKPPERKRRNVHAAIVRARQIRAEESV